MDFFTGFHPFMTTVLQMDSVFYNIPKRLFFLLPRLPLSGILLFLRLDFAFDVVVLFLILHSRLQFLNLLQELIFPPFSAAMIFSAVVVTDQVTRRLFTR